jgi:hypothetical protein
VQGCKIQGLAIAGGVGIFSFLKGTAGQASQSGTRNHGPGLGALVFLMYTLARSIRNEHTAGHSVWREFSLGLSLMALFFVSWVGQGISQWQTYTDQQFEHGQSTSFGDFVSDFGQATLENWQSEFLQLFSFVVFSALLIHHGSAESKDGTDRIEQSVKRIEKRLDDAGIGSSGSVYLPLVIATACRKARTLMKPIRTVK